MEDSDTRFVWKCDFDPIAIHFTETFGIRYYGLAYVLGFLIGLWLLNRYFKSGRSALNPDEQSNLFLYLMIGVIVGGRLGYFLFYQTETLFSNPLEFFQFTKGGMASHGGFIGVAVACLYAAKRFEKPFWHIADIVTTLTPAGLLLGRIANYINGELWGKPTSGSWGVLFPGAPDGGTIPRHPSQLYEASLEGLLLLLYSQWRVWRTPVLNATPGQLGGEFLLAYSIVRILGEFFREPDYGIDPVFGFLNRGAVLSIFLALCGIAIIATAKIRAKANLP